MPGSPELLVDDDLQLTLAAGGLVWAPDGGRRRLAVIHRARHDDWTLPKGKVERGERPRETALREVREETGCEAEATGYAGSVSYDVDGQPKLVLFWHMEVKRGGRVEPGEEVDHVVWLSPENAIARLDYPGERALLERIVRSGGGTPYIGRRIAAAILAPLSTLLHSRAQRRLDGAIRTYAGELGWRIAASGSRSAAWAPAAEQLLDEARRCVRRGREDAGWQALQGAQRLSIFGMSDGERQTHAAALVAEVGKKLSGSWRGQAIRKALGEPGSVPDPESLWYATAIRDESAQNEYRKLAVLGDQLTSMGLLVGLLLVLLVLLAARVPLPLDPAVTGNSFEQLIYIVLFGMLGGAVSVMIPRAGDRKLGRIPEQLSQAAFGRLRPLLGAASAVVVYLAFLANLLPPAITGDDAGAVILLVAFAAGFSERLIIRAVEKVAGQTDAARPAPETADQESERRELPQAIPYIRNIAAMTRGYGREPGAPAEPAESAPVSRPRTVPSGGGPGAADEATLPTGRDS